MSLNRQDIVTIKTTKNVKWLSAPPGEPTSPKGEWCVIEEKEGVVLLVKEKTCIRIPVSDTVLVARYDLGVLLKELDKTNPLKKVKT